MSSRSHSLAAYCTEDQIAAYGKLVEVTHSPWRRTLQGVPDRSTSLPHLLRRCWLLRSPGQSVKFLRFSRPVHRNRGDFISVDPVPWVAGVGGCSRAPGRGGSAARLGRDDASLARIEPRLVPRKAVAVDALANDEQS